MRPMIGDKAVYGEAKGHKRRELYRWDGKPKRRPRKGEYYLVGSAPTAWRAEYNMLGKYFIAERVE